MENFDIVILSNGPGEITTWVRPVVEALRQQLGDDRSKIRISVVLSPCPNGTGKEAAIASSYPEVDRVQAAEHFWQFLLRGKTAENWQWRDRGVVVFLGGDQIFPVIIGKRLNYRTVVYAEWETRWHRWIDRFGVMQAKIIPQNRQFAHKFAVVGDLMVEAGQTQTNDSRDVAVLRLPTENDTHNRPPSAELIGLLPGSKAAKLAQGVPLLLAVAEIVKAERPQTQFVIPVAPTLDLETLASFANLQQNPVIEQIGGVTAELIVDPSPILKTYSGLCVQLWTRSPAYDLLSQCCLCLTTVGANTAELGALAVPMIVLLPTQQLDAMRAWDGLPGILANLPLVGTTMAKAINWTILHLPRRLYAWPNIWAKSEVVPELVGKLQASDIANMVLDFLAHPEKLAQISDRLRSIRGEAGAAQKLATLVREELQTQTHSHPKLFSSN
ncbi:lipid-A-disaccharide synthase [Aliterella atlantica CENA595]|uniref:Lipid-A-disaccharide synthase n=1 Tax=Aliterella atlantica CENA595 TaxID=1618023 RepID=A0A0D8ZTF2_9CYAN|nr:lipid-A-disaccharide synthase [Aliterella atlantica CENA595]